MKIAGAYSLPLPRERAYALLQDPVILAKCMPGCEGLDRTGEGEYTMRMKMVIASVSGQFAGRVVIADPEPPAGFRMVVEGAGRIGFMKGEGRISLADSVAATAVSYEGDVQVGGVIANVGQRLIETTAKMLIKRFFERLTTQAAAAAQAALGAAAEALPAEPPPPAVN
ncbi:MAG TPA: carbon monoxide dehydrogenase subunit G [Candidatus Sulfopaludibacter sp.]|nr:carbon monoxide dehydrogenase subunit G [Candidatus Sulfopaludibacter sp.]